MAKKLTTEGFIEKAKAVHGNKYTYEKSTYTGNKGILTATCSLHGDFTITPDKHIRRAKSAQIALQVALWAQQSAGYMY